MINKLLIKNKVKLKILKLKKKMTTCNSWNKCFYKRHNLELIKII